MSSITIAVNRYYNQLLFLLNSTFFLTTEQLFQRSKKCRIQTDLICELGCSKQRQFESEQALELHLFSLHGGSMDDDSMNNDAM
jgi:hypothetical protein